MADALDSKSGEGYSSWGFESPLWHHFYKKLRISSRVETQPNRFMLRDRWGPSQNGKRVRKIRVTAWRDGSLGRKTLGCPVYLPSGKPSDNKHPRPSSSRRGGLEPWSRLWLQGLARSLRSLHKNYRCRCLRTIPRDSRACHEDRRDSATWCRRSAGQIP